MLDSMILELSQVLLLLLSLLLSLSLFLILLLLLLLLLLLFYTNIITNITFCKLLIILGL